MANDEAAREIGCFDWQIAVRGVVGDDLGAEHVRTRKGTFVRARERHIGRKEIRGWMGEDVVEAVYKKHS